MAPKGKAPKSGGEGAGVAAAVALLATPEKALEAFTTLAELAATEDGMVALREGMGEVLPPAVSALEAALGATDDETVASTATGAAKVIGALGGGSAEACAGVVRAEGVLASLAGLCGGVGIEQLDASPHAAVLLEAVCAALKDLMGHSVGRLYARKAAVCAPLLALLSSTLVAHEAVQVEASLALSHACESALLRTQLHMHVPALVSLCHSVIQLVQYEGKWQKAPDHQKQRVLQVLGPCLHDASLRPALLDAGVLGVAVKAVPASEEEGVERAEELRLSAAATLAIAARSPEGRGLLLQLHAPAALLAVLRGGAAPAEGGEPLPPPPPSALTAAACLGVAHLALLPPAAEALASLGVVPLLLPSLAPPAADADADAAATARANASTALQHLSLAMPQAVAEAGAAAAVGGLLGQSPPLPPSLVISALEIVASGGRSGAARDAMCAEARGEGEGEGEAPSCLRAVVAEMVASKAEMVAAGAAGAAEAAVRLETALTALTALAPADAACRLMRGAPAAPPAALPGAEAEAEAEAEAAAGGEVAAAEQGGEGEGEGGGGGVGVAASPFATVLAVLAARPSAALCRAAASCFAAFASADAACAAALVQLGALGQLLAQTEEGGAAQASRAAANSVCAAHGPAQLWNTGLVPPEVPVGDGFYAVGADGSFGDLDEQRREGQALAHASETLLVDSAADPGLAQCVAAARAELEALGAEVSPQAAAAALARIVAAWQGGAVPYSAYEHYDNRAELGDLRHASGCRVVHLGELRRGRARQRALLFKALADAVSAMSSKCNT